MAKLDLTKYGIQGTPEIVYNPSYDLLYKDETNPRLEEARQRHQRLKNFLQDMGW